MNTTWVAMAMVLLGFGAGAFGAFSEDLLYGLLVSAIFLVVNTGLRFRSVDRQLTDLVRALALHDAELRHPATADPDTHP